MGLIPYSKKGSFLGSLGVHSNSHIRGFSEIQKLINPLKTPIINKIIKLVLLPRDPIFIPFNYLNSLCGNFNQKQDFALVSYVRFMINHICHLA